MARIKYCDWCSHPIVGKDGKPRRKIPRHANIYNNPKYHYFCSEECKREWIKDASASTIELVVGDGI